MISLALLFHFKTRTGRTQIETLPKACTAHCPPPLPTASPAFATAHAWHLPLPRALWQINHFHLQQHTVLNIHRTPFSFLSLLLLFLSVSLLLLLLFLPWQINLHSAQLRVVRKKVKKKTVEISIKNLIISIVDKLLGINLAARRQQRLLPEIVVPLPPSPIGIIRVS